jgi:hypothetical protein
MLKRQGKGESMGAPVRGEAVIGMLSASDPDGPAGTWDPPRRTLDGGFNSIDKRFKRYGPPGPKRFTLKDAN